MTDLAHYFGNDLLFSATGDLAAVDVPVVTQQRLLRRLLTNPGDYIWHPGYGAGLGRFVGQPINVAQIRAIVRRQVLMERAVARTPAPVITVQAAANNTATVTIRYADAATGQVQTLSTPVG